MTMALLTLPDDALVLRTERLVAAPIKPDDANALYPHMSNPEIPRYMSWDAHTSEDETRRFTEAAAARMQKREVLHWCLWEDSKCAGLFSIIDIKTTHRALTYHQGECAYWCAPHAQGKGLMTEAGTAIVNFAFDVAGFHKLTVAHRTENDKSKGLIERLGFTHVGLQRDHYQKDGIWHSQHLYEMLAGEHHA